MPAVDGLGAGTHAHDVTLGFFAGDVAHHVDVVTALRHVTLVERGDEGEFTSFPVQHIDGVGLCHLAAEGRDVQVAEIVNAYRIGTQGCTAIDVAVQRQGQRLDQVAVGGIHLIDHALHQRIGALDNGLRIGVCNVDVAIGHHCRARTGVAVGHAGPYILGVDTVLNPDVFDANLVDTFVFHAIGHSPSGGYSRSHQ